MRQWGQAIANYALEKEWPERIGMALLEVAVVAAIGLVPLFFAAFLSPDDSGAALKDASGGLLRFIGAGQLFLYCFSFIGTLGWLFMKAMRTCHIAQIAAIFVMILGLALASIYIPTRDPSMTADLPDYQASLSIICYIIALVLYFILLMTASAVATPPDEQSRRKAARIAAKVEGKQ